MKYELLLCSFDRCVKEGRKIIHLVEHHRTRKWNGRFSTSSLTPEVTLLTTKVSSILAFFPPTNKKPCIITLIGSHFPINATRWNTKIKSWKGYGKVNQKRLWGDQGNIRNLTTKPVSCFLRDHEDLAYRLLMFNLFIILTTSFNWLPSR